LREHPFQIIFSLTLKIPFCVFRYIGQSFTSLAEQSARRTFSGKSWTPRTPKSQSGMDAASPALARFRNVLPVQNGVFGVRNVAFDLASSTACAR
jgi:hypothetical protein